MRNVAITAMPLLMALGPAALGTHDEGCIPTQADPSTINSVEIPVPVPVGGQDYSGLYYVEERGNPLDTSPPAPFTSFLLGQGTWIYHERNGLVGLQRGGDGFIPYLCPLVPPLPCVWIDQDNIYDQNCGAGPDELIV